MSLFDVKSLSGVYARMNDLYSKLGEVHNVMKTLKDLLGLSTCQVLLLKINLVFERKNKHRDVRLLLYRISKLDKYCSNSLFS